MDPPFTKLDILDLPQPPDLSDAGAAEKAPAALSLQPESRRRPVSGERGDRQQLHRPLRAAEHQVATLPAARIRPAGRAARVSRLVCPRPPGVPKELIMLKPAVNLQSLADQLLLQHFSPPAVLVNDKGDILYISGRTGKYLEPAAGKANWNIFAMAREGLRFELGSAFQKALRQKEAVTVKGLKVGDRRQHADRRYHGPGDRRAGGAAGDGDDRLYRRGNARRKRRRRAAPGPHPSGSARVSRTGAGTPAAPRRTADHPRGDANLAGRAQIHQRGAAVHQRGAAVHQRGADHLQGRDAVPERRAADGERRAAVQNGRTLRG